MVRKQVSVSVLGLSGKEKLKGATGVGKSLLCNRFVRGQYDAFRAEHSSVLSQADFAGSPVINNDHWLYFGERRLDSDDIAAESVIVRVAEQTEFVDDETFEPLACSSLQGGYAQRASRIRLTSRDKMMYIEREQLGLEGEYEQMILPEGKFDVDCFIYVFDVSVVEGRTFESQFNFALSTLKSCLKTKKPIVLALSKCDAADEAGRRSAHNLLARKELKNSHIPIIETSALKDVNVDELFLTCYQLVAKGKSRLKVLTYSEAAKLVEESNRQARISFKHLLVSLLPIENWPLQRVAWNDLKQNSRLEEKAEYKAFLRVYGEKAARKLYEEHVNEAKERWMACRLRACTNQLPKIFSQLIDNNELVALSWPAAKGLVLSHPLFDQFFQPLGFLGRQLDPLASAEDSADDGSLQADGRLPAEVLLTGEAKTTFEAYQKALLFPAAPPSTLNLTESAREGFIFLSPESEMDHSHHSAMTDFFHRMHDIVPASHRVSQLPIERRKTSDGYSTLVDFNAKLERRNGSNQATGARMPTLLQAAVYSPPMQPRRRDSSHTHYSTLTSSDSVSPRRRPAPHSHFKLPISSVRNRLSDVANPQAAPLATPDPLDVTSPDFVKLQRQFSNGETSHQVVDFATPPMVNEPVVRRRQPTAIRPTEQKRGARPRIFSATSAVSSFEPMSPASVSARSDSTQSRSSGSGGHVFYPCSHIPSRSAPSNHSSPRTSMTSSTSSASLKGKENTNMFQRHTTRAQTTIIAVNGENGEDDGIKIPEIKPKKLGKLNRYRQSLSAESVAELIKKSDEKKKLCSASSGQRLVRRVATSFRFRKKNQIVEAAEEKLTQQEGSRSLPQTPATERKTRKLLAMGSSERLASALSWLPSRSPKKSKSSTGEMASPSSVQGSILSALDTLESLTDAGRKLPPFLVKCIQYIEQEGGLETEGLYRVPGNQLQVAEVEKVYRKKGVLKLDDVQLPIHVVCTAVKNLFSSLPKPLIPYSLHSAILECVEGSEADKIIPQLSKLLLEELPQANYLVLRYLMIHLNMISTTPLTAMDSKNLSKVWFPTIFRPAFESYEAFAQGTQQLQLTTELLISSASTVFSPISL